MLITIYFSSSSARVLVADLRNRFRKGIQLCSMRTGHMIAKHVSNLQRIFAARLCFADVTNDFIRNFQFKVPVTFIRDDFK